MGDAYHYVNADGSEYFSNVDGSAFYDPGNSGKGRKWYRSPDGVKHYLPTSDDGGDDSYESDGNYDMGDLGDNDDMDDIDNMDDGDDGDDMDDMYGGHALDDSDEDSTVYLELPKAPSIVTLLAYTDPSPTKTNCSSWRSSNWIPSQNKDCHC